MVTLDLDIEANSSKTLEKTVNVIIHLFVVWFASICTLLELEVETPDIWCSLHMFRGGPWGIVKFVTSERRVWTNHQCCNESCSRCINGAARFVALTAPATVLSSPAYVILLQFRSERVRVAKFCCSPQLIYCCVDERPWLALDPKLSHSIHIQTTGAVATTTAQIDYPYEMTLWISDMGTGEK